MEALQKAMQDFDKKLDGFIKSSNEEAESNAKLGRENKSAMEKLNGEAAELKERLADVEQKMSSRAESEKPSVSMGDQFTKSADYERFAKGGTSKMTLEVKNTVIGSDATVGPDRQSQIIGGAQRSLRVMNAMPIIPTASNAVEYTRELVTTLAAAETGEGNALPESTLTYELVNAPVRTIGHWIKLSKQVIDDAPALAAHINTRLAYGAELRLDTQILNGNGTGSNLSGLTAAGNHTVFTPTASESAIAGIRRAIALVEASEYMPTAIFMNSADVAALDLEQGTDDHFLAGNPRLQVSATAWGLPVIKTNAVAAGKVVVGAFDLATALNMREGVMIEMSDSDDTNFTSNLVTVKANVRAALSIYRPAAVAYGDLTGV